MRRVVRAAVIYGGVTVALLWPLFERFGSAFAHDAGDSVLNTWILWWGTRATPLTQAWWNGPMFFPATDSMALSELLLAFLPIFSLVHTLTANPVAAFNTVYAVSFAASGLAAYLLARDLTGREDAGIVGGLAFLLAPYRADQLSHVQVLSYYWAPLVLLGLHRYVQERRWRWLVLFGLASLLQALANGYAIFQLPVLVVLWVLWFARPLRTAAPIAVAGALAALPMVPLLLTYRAVHDRLHLLRDINEVKQFGVDVADFLTASPDLLVWGGRLGAARPETAVFPGLTIVVVAVAALIAERGVRWGDPATDGKPPRRWTRALAWFAAGAALVAFSVKVVGPWAIGPLTVGEFRKPWSVACALALAAFLGGNWTRRLWRERSVAGFYILATAAMYLLALGPEPRLWGTPVLYEPPYAWLMRLPGFDAMRVPARFVMLAGLCQAVLLALAVSRWAVGPRRLLVVALLAAGVAADGWIRLPVGAVHAGGIRSWEGVAAVIELPLGNVSADFGALYRSMAHHVPIVNGVSGYYPPHVLPLAQALRAGEYAALFEISPDQSIGVALDRTRRGSHDAELGLKTIGARAGPVDGNWAGFIVLPKPTPRLALGAAVPIASVRTPIHADHVERMLDDDLFTAWGTEAPQGGGEEVLLDLGVSRPLAALVLEMGAYSFGYPKVLEIDLSEDGTYWVPAPRQQSGVLAVRAAVRAPSTVPMAFELGSATARFIRLRQVGADPALPWWVAELRVYGLAPRADQRPNRSS